MGVHLMRQGDYITDCLPGLLEGFLGSKRWIASRLGQVGGKSKSMAKRAAARVNGKLGGRPRKAVSVVSQKYVEY